MASDSLDHLCAAVSAARGRYGAHPLAISVGAREYQAIQQHLTYQGLLGPSVSPCPAVMTFLGYPLTVRDAPYGVWVVPVEA